MERLKVKIAGAFKALATLREVTGIDEVPAITRDAAIQRFEFTFEAIWKVAKMYLKEFKNLYLSAARPPTNNSSNNHIVQCTRGIQARFAWHSIPPNLYEI